jgi:glycosyltransferase involved in cell wall biosynthesis
MIEKIAVLGAGLMGHGIAQVAVQTAKYDVYMHDIKQEFIDNGIRMIKGSLPKGIKKGEITNVESEQVLVRIHPVIGMKEAITDADLKKNMSQQALMKHLSINVVIMGQGPTSWIKYMSGGAVRHLEIIKGLTREQNVILCVISTKRYCDFFQANGVKAYCKIVPHFIGSENFLAQIIDSIVRSFYVCVAPFHIQNGDILIHSPSDFIWDTFPPFIKKRWNKRVKWFSSVYHFVPHPSERAGGFSISNLLSFIAQRMSLPLVTRWSDMIQTETNFMRDELIRRYRVSPEKIIVCQSGINPKVIDNFSWSKGKIYDACFLARLHKSKGIYDLIKAWQYVCEHKKDAKLAIAGNGPTEIINEIKNIIKTLDLERNVFFLGFLSEKKKYELLKASKMYVLPSGEEGIPLTFYEAMYCGLPVITYYLPTYEEIRDYIESVPLGDVEGLANRILRVLDDEELMRRLGEHGRKEAIKHTWDKVADCILSRIEAIVHE